MKKYDISIGGRWLYVAGGVLTGLYLLMLTIYCVDRWPEVRVMSPNNLGDFFAGAFSPLAFAWLVLGFIQQGIELRQNSAALILQAEELRSAATHAGAMVELQRKDFDLRIQELEGARQKTEAANAAQVERREKLEVQRIQPEFYFSLGFRDDQARHIVRSSLTNSGPICTNVKILMTAIPGILQLAESPEFAEFSTQLCHPVVFASYNTTPRTHPLMIRYTDNGGTERIQKFIVSVDRQNLHIRKDDDPD